MILCINISLSGFPNEKGMGEYALEMHFFFYTGDMKIACIKYM